MAAQQIPSGNQGLRSGSRGIGHRASPGLSVRTALFEAKSPAKCRHLRRNGAVRVQFPHLPAGPRREPGHESGWPTSYPRARPRGGRDAQPPRRRHLSRRHLRRRRLQPRHPRYRGNPRHRHRPRPIGHRGRLRSGGSVGRPADAGRGPLLQSRRDLRRAGPVLGRRRRDGRRRLLDAARPGRARLLVSARRPARHADGP